MKKDFSDSIKRLQDSPLFALSLHGTELAHSNFWKWLIDYKVEKNDKETHPFIDVFINDFNKCEYFFQCAKREEGNRDLTIYYSDGNQDCCFVIENKIKSIPTVEQLEKYQKVLDEKASQKKNTPKFVGGMLTGIISTLDLKEPWSFKSYENIARGIETIGNKIFRDDVDNTDWIVVQKYISDLRDETVILSESLDACKNKYIASTEGLFPDYNLAGVKLDDIFLKINANHFGEYIRTNIQNAGFSSTNGFLPKVEVSFNNKRPTITIVYSEKCDKKFSKLEEFGRLGIQIEGQQYRIYGGSSSKRSQYKTARDIFDAFKKSKWFKEYDKGLLAGKKSSMRGSNKEKSNQYCLYTKENEYVHIYQYWDIDSLCSGTDKSVTYEELWRQIEADLLIAKGIIDSGFSFKQK